MDSDNEKTMPLEALARRGEEYRRAGRRIVWTNGCFDLLHAGHIASLQAAKALGDILIVGINSDASVRALKGPDRPLVPEAMRANVLAALACVDHVLVFRGTRCTEELARIRPDIYAQGSDYTLETIDQDERRAVEQGGGRVAFLPFVQGFSTSNLMKKIRRGDPEKVISGAFALIRDDADRLLMVANQYSEGVRWGLPGGGHERDETLREAVVRETREEVGLEVKVTRYVGLIERLDPALNLHLLAHQFEAEAVGGELCVSEKEEHVIDAQYLSRAEVAGHPGVVLGRQYLLQYIDDRAAYPPYIFMGPGEE